MKHKRWINFIVVLALSLGSGEVVLGDQQAAQGAPTEARAHAASGSNSASVEVIGAYHEDVENRDYVWNIGGVDAVAVVGDYAYVGEGPSLTILDVSSPSTPVVVGRSNLIPYDGPEGHYGVDYVTVAGNYAYVGSDGLRVIDVSDPANPIEVGYFGIGRSDVAVQGDYAYVADEYYGLWVVDVSDPTNPTEVGYCNTPAVDVVVDGDYAYVAGWSSGLRVVDVSNPAYPIEVGNTSGYAYSVAVEGGYAYVVESFFGSLDVIDVSDPSNPYGVSSTYTPEGALGVAVVGGYAYVTLEASDTSGWLGSLRVFDVSNPASPSEVDFYDTTGSAYDVAVAGGYAYVANGGGLAVIDVSDPASLSEAGFYHAPGDARQVAVAGHYAYVTDLYHGLWVIDWSDPANPIGVGFAEVGFPSTLSPPDDSHRVAVAGGYAYAAGWDNGLRVIDVSNPANPAEVGFTYTWDSAYDVAVAGDFAYVADGLGGLRVIDISDPSSPSEVGFYDPPGFTSANGVAVAGGYAYLIDGDLRVIDVSDPASPVEVGFFDTPHIAQHVAVAGNYVYMTDGYLRVIDVSDPANPFEVGFYATTGDVAVVGDYAFVLNLSDYTSVRVIDVSDPAYPVEAGFYVTPGFAYGVAAEGSYAYVASGLGGLIILDYMGLDLKAHTTTTITSDAPDPSQLGQPISVSFEVTASSGTPTGTVTVTAPGEPAVWTGTLTGGVGECEIFLNFLGTTNLTAVYSGDDHYLPSSDVEGHTVVEKQATIREDTTTTILSDEPDPSQVGQSFTVTFEVTAESGIPSGVVHVQVAGEPMDCFGTLTGGTGECEIIALTVPRTYTLTAAYDGDNDFLPSSDVEEHKVGEQPVAPSVRLFLPLVTRK
jgi:hypothetical protein